jgi:hypothetical protein
VKRQNGAAKSHLRIFDGAVKGAGEAGEKKRNKKA